MIEKQKIIDAIKELEAETDGDYYLEGMIDPDKLKIKLRITEKCTDDSCDEEATEERFRGIERIPYCKNHARAWDNLLGYLA